MSLQQELNNDLPIDQHVDQESIKEQRKLKRKENQKIKREKKKEQKDLDDKYYDYMKSKYDKDIAYNELLIKNIQGEIKQLESSKDKNNNKIKKLKSMVDSTKQDILFLKSEKLRYDFDFKQRNSIQTELCSKTLKGKVCNFEGCWYAHSLEEIRKPKCIYNINNCCTKGDSCVYDHTDSPLPEFPKRIINEDNTISTEDNTVNNEDNTVSKNTYCQHLYQTLSELITFTDEHIEHNIRKIVGMFYELPIDEIKSIDENETLLYEKVLEAIIVLLSDTTNVDLHKLSLQQFYNLIKDKSDLDSINKELESIHLQQSNNHLNSSINLRCETPNIISFQHHISREYLYSPELPSESTYLNDVSYGRENLVTPEIFSEYICTITNPSDLQEIIIE